MTTARWVDLGIGALWLGATAIAFAIGFAFSWWIGALLALAAALAVPSLVVNFDYWVVRRLVEAEDGLFYGLCDTGFIGRTRALAGRLPASPRCRFCLLPFRGLGRLLGIRASAKNPNFCRSCFELAPNDAQEMPAGVLFADIRGFTSFSEAHSPTEAAERLTRFYALASRVLTRDDALVELVGDQVMALYLPAMPSLRGRVPEVMLAAARRLVHEVRAAESLLPVGVGLHVGTALVGNVQKGEMKDFTAVGDVVNTAARLQSRAGEYEIVLSESVYREIADEAPEARGTALEVKGKAEPIEAHVIPAPA